MKISKTKAKTSKSSTSAADQKINLSFSENALKMLKKRYLQNKENGEQETPAEMFHRVAHAVAEVEKKYNADPAKVSQVEKDFFNIISSKEFTPAGRTMTNAGAKTSIVANCIVLPIEDSMESIFQTLKDAALLQQAGSGLGFDFTDLRPAMFITKKSNGVSSGPVSFLRVYNEAFGIIKQQGRHGANMAMMQIDHPDILDFVRAKAVEGDIRNFNISIKVTDEFMKLMDTAPETKWMCTWKGEKYKPRKVLRAPNGAVTGVEELDITVKEIFDEIVNYAWHNGEPGIVFIDEVNRTNPLPGLGWIKTSNPCGEQFLHAYDNCNLGSINLSLFVKNGKIDFDRLKFVTRTATRMLDDVIDTFNFPVEQVTELANKNRRIGLGIMGLADMLYQLGVSYNSEEGRKIGEKVMKAINDASHEMSRELANEKGIFPNWDLSIYKKKNIKMRNAALTTVAPTGSISMMFDCSSGIEPNFALAFVKQDKDGHQYHYFNSHFEKAMKDAKLSKEQVEEIKAELLKTGSIQRLTNLPEKLRKTFVVAMDISAEDHMKMQAAFQKHVDNSISKTINFPNNATKEEVRDSFITAWKLKCKSSTVYRDGSRNVQVLNLGTGEGLTAPSEIGIKKDELKLPADTMRHGARKRPEVMIGKTYKVKTGYGSLYITINNDEHGEPFEIFATIGKSGGFFQEQSEAICRLISISLRSGMKISEIIDNLKGIRGPMPTMTEKGTILSLPDAIGKILEEHTKISETLVTPTDETSKIQNLSEETKQENVRQSIADYGVMPGCPDCGSALQIAEGCMSCKSCGFSRCG